jgi:hypothetical protein
VAIYLDANVLRGQPAGPAFSAVRAVAKAHALEIVVPAIALEEATALRRREISAAIEEVETALKNARWAFPPPRFDAPDPEQLASEWSAEFVSGLTVLPVSPEHATESLRREILRVEPTREGKGARDAAVWLALRDDHLARTEVGYFLSANHRDFCESDGTTLLSSLRDEVAMHAHPLHYVASIEALLGLLAERKGAEFSIEELKASEGLDLSVQTVLNGRRLGSSVLDALLLVTIGEGIARWASVDATFKPPVLHRIDHQAVFTIQAGREVAVVQTTWVGWVGLDAMALGASLTMAEASLVRIPVQIWVRRDGDADLAVELSHVGNPEIVPDSALP